MSTSWPKTFAARALWHTGALGLTRSLWRERLLILRYHSIRGDREKPEYHLTIDQRPCHRVRATHQAPVALVRLPDAGRGGDVPHVGTAPAVPCGGPDVRRWLSGQLSIRAADPGSLSGARRYLSGEQHAPRASRPVDQPTAAVLHRPTVSKLTLPGLYPSTLPLDTEAARASAARTLRHAQSDERGRSRRLGRQIAGLTGRLRRLPWTNGSSRSSRFVRCRRTGSRLAHTPCRIRICLESRPKMREWRSRARVPSSKRLLGTEVAHFSYPNSGGVLEHFNEFTVRCAREAGYRSAVTSPGRPLHRWLRSVSAPSTRNQSRPIIPRPIQPPARDGAPRAGCTTRRGVLAPWSCLHTPAPNDSSSSARTFRPTGVRARIASFGWRTSVNEGAGPPSC